MTTTNMTGTPNRVFAFLDGKRVKLDGVWGVLRHTVHHARYPYSRTVEALNHVPTEAGRRSEEYRRIRRELGDDWSTDLTDAIETYCGLATKLGYDWADEKESEKSGF